MSTRDQSQIKDTQISQLTGHQKAALLLIGMDAEVAAKVFKYLDPVDVELLSAEITRVRSIPSSTVDTVMSDYYGMITAREYVLEGGLEYAQEILEKSFGLTKALEIIEKVKSITTLHGFDVLKKADSTQLVNFLSKEHPQTIALILAHLSPDQTAATLKELPVDLRIDVAFRIAALGKISPQTLKQIEKVVDELAGVSISQSVKQIGGPKSLATILNRTSVSVSREILGKLDEFDSDVAYEVKRLMFLFEDIIHIPSKDIQRILKEVDRKDLALALKTVDEKLRTKIMSNMSQRAADLLKEELQYMGLVKLKEVEGAQARIVDVIKSLEEQGEISVNLRGGNEEVYV